MLPACIGREHWSRAIARCLFMTISLRASTFVTYPLQRGRYRVSHEGEFHFTVRVICFTITRHHGQGEPIREDAGHISGGLDIGYQYEPVTITCRATQGGLRPRALRTSGI